MKRKYEAIFILKANQKESEIKAIAQELSDSIVKNNGAVSLSEVWMAKRRFTFPIKKHKDGTYYKILFTADTAAIKAIKQAYRLNDKILRLMISNLDD
ncbi:MAG: 30S ribosomal protein S6 [Candidatus Omnitrophota bacterium]